MKLPVLNTAPVFAQLVGQIPLWAFETENEMILLNYAN